MTDAVKTSDHAKHPDMRERKPTLAHRAEYYTMRATIGALRGLSWDAACKVGERLGALGYRPLGIRKRVVEKQIAAAFPDLGHEAVRNLARESYEHLGAPRVARGASEAHDEDEQEEKTTADEHHQGARVRPGVVDHELVTGGCGAGFVCHGHQVRTLRQVLGQLHQQVIRIGYLYGGCRASADLHRGRWSQVLAEDHDVGQHGRVDLDRVQLVNLWRKADGCGPGRRRFRCWSRALGGGIGRQAG